MSIIYKQTTTNIVAYNSVPLPIKEEEKGNLSIQYVLCNLNGKLSISTCKTHKKKRVTKM